MALSTLRNLFELTEENAISKFQDINIISSSKLCVKERKMKLTREIIANGVLVSKWSTDFIIL